MVDISNWSRISAFVSAPYGRPDISHAYSLDPMNSFECIPDDKLQCCVRGPSFTCHEV